MEVTVNQLLTQIKVARERCNGLKSLRNSVSTKESFYYSQTDKTQTTEPQYDVKKVDKKVAELEKFLYKADALVKQSNAITKVDIAIDVDTLLDPIE